MYTQGRFETISGTDLEHIALLALGEEQPLDLLILLFPLRFASGVSRLEFGVKGEGLRGVGGEGFGLRVSGSGLKAHCSKFRRSGV